jgi:hypothetical protein
MGEKKSDALLPYLDALAEFSNLKDEKEAAFFRRKHQQMHFVPDRWWDYRPGGSVLVRGRPLYDGPIWLRNQAHLREVWSKSFEDTFFNRMRLVLSVFDPADIEDRNGMRPVFMSLADLEDRVIAYEEQVEAGQTAKVDDFFCPYQRAVLFLFEQSWRAKICARCRKRFIAVSPHTERCSLECRDIRIKDRHNKWGKDNNWGRPRLKPKRRPLNHSRKSSSKG